jgi:hypothetical protein
MCSNCAGNYENPDMTVGAEAPDAESEELREPLIGYLTYRSYAHNRKLSPEVTPEQWETVFGASVKEMEARFQREAKRSI